LEKEGNNNSAAEVAKEEKENKNIFINREKEENDNIKDSSIEEEYLASSLNWQRLAHLHKIEPL